MSQEDEARRSRLALLMKLCAMLPKDHCQMCAQRRPIVDTHQVTFTVRLHTVVDGTYDIRVCAQCDANMKAHPSFRAAGKA